jgi:4-amino-4-deoxy-L-arabinose transferase-like glycosyltransferase
METTKALIQRKWFFPLLLMLLWLLAILIVDPYGEFPINDDWAYTKNVYELSVNRTFYVDDWPSMTLVSQVLYGALFTKVFGFSFSVLRISILLLSVASSLVIYLLLKKRCGNDLIAFILTVGFCFSQIYFALSFTFMTDIFFLSFFIFSVYSLINYLEHLRNRDYIFFILFCLIAVLNRQQGLLLPLLVVLPLLWKRKWTIKNCTIAFLPFVICLSGHFAYRYLLNIYNIIPGSMQDKEKFILVVKNLRLSVLHFQAGDMLMVAGWILVSCSAILLFCKPFSIAASPAIFFPVAIIIICITYPAWENFPNGNIFNANGIGPKILKDYWINIARKYNSPEWFKWLLKIISLGSVSIIVLNTLKVKNNFFDDKKVNHGFVLSLFFILLVYTLFSVINVYYFDRYVLPIGFVLLFINVPNVEKVKASFKFPLFVLAFIFYVAVVFEEKDYMNWQRTRWKALTSLQEQGVSPHFIDGGFEFNAWFKPGNVNPASDERSWWWVDKDDYMIANGNHPGYISKSFFTYQHYLPYEMDTLYVLQKN